MSQDEAMPSCHSGMNHEVQVLNVRWAGHSRRIPCPLLLGTVQFQSQN